MSLAPADETTVVLTVLVGFSVALMYLGTARIFRDPHAPSPVPDATPPRVKNLKIDGDDDDADPSKPARLQFDFDSPTSQAASEPETPQLEVSNVLRRVVSTTKLDTDNGEPITPREIKEITPRHDPSYIDPTVRAGACRCVPPPPLLADRLPAAAADDFAQVEIVDPPPLVAPWARTDPRRLALLLASLGLPVLCLLAATRAKGAAAWAISALCVSCALGLLLQYGSYLEQRMAEPRDDVNVAKKLF